MAYNLLINSILIFSIFSVDFLETEKILKDADACQSIEVEVSVENTNGTSSTGKVEVHIKGAKAPILYFFSYSNGQMVDDNYKQSSKASLKVGKYVCTIKEAGGCRKKIEFEIK